MVNQATIKVGQKHNVIYRIKHEMLKQGFSWEYVLIEVGCIGLALICYRMYNYHDYLERKTK
jgi:hypothetical protein